MRPQTLAQKLGIGLVSLATLLPGCASTQKAPEFYQPAPQASAETLPTSPKYQPNSKENEQNKQGPERKTKPTTLSAVVSDTFQSDFALASGSKVGKGPLNLTYLNATLEGEVGTLNFYTYSYYSIPTDKTVAESFTIDAKIPITKNFFIKAGIEDFVMEATGGTPFALLGIGYRTDNNLEFTLNTRTILDETLGAAYLIGISKRIEFTGTDFAITPKIKIGYNDDYAKNNGWMYATPGFDVNLGKIGPFNVNGFFSYQIALTNKKESFPMGGISLELKSPKLTLGHK